jgi:hypothetical protein
LGGGPWRPPRCSRLSCGRAVLQPMVSIVTTVPPSLRTPSRAGIAGISLDSLPTAPIRTPNFGRASPPSPARSPMGHRAVVPSAAFPIHHLDNLREGRREYVRFRLPQRCPSGGEMNPTLPIDPTMPKSRAPSSHLALGQSWSNTGSDIVRAMSRAATTPRSQTTPNRTPTPQLDACVLLYTNKATPHRLTDPHTKSREGNLDCP